MPLPSQILWESEDGFNSGTPVSGSANFGQNQTWQSTYASRKTSKGTSPPGKLWRNYVLYSQSIRNSNAAQDLSLSNLDRTTQAQKLISTMVSPLQRSSPILSSWSPLFKCSSASAYKCITFQERRTSKLMTLAGVGFQLLIRNSKLIFIWKTSSHQQDSPSTSTTLNSGTPLFTPWQNEH